MESRLLYESSKAYSRKIDWIKLDHAESEWLYFDLDHPAAIANVIDSFFTSDKLIIAQGRKDSIIDDKSLIYSKIKESIGKIDYLIWDDKFGSVMAISKIGVYRTGRRND